MKRYFLKSYAHIRIEEDPDGPWVYASDAETRIARLEGLLRELEWAADEWDPTCPICGVYQHNGVNAGVDNVHAPDCRLAAALKESK